MKCLCSERLLLLEPVEMALGEYLLIRHLGYPRAGRACMQPGQHAIHLVDFALKQRFYRAVVKVAHPSGDLEPMSLANGGGPKADALHAAGNAHG